MQGSDFEDLVNIFTKFPGIGPRQARRFVYFLLSRDRIFRGDFLKSIDALNQKAKQCVRCHYFFVAHHKDNNLCRRCDNIDLDHSTIMIVEKDMDVDNIIKTETYKGLFFILGHLKTSKDSDKFTSYNRLNSLKKLLTTEGKLDTLKEIILAFSASPDGDNMTRLLKDELAQIAQDFKIKISSLGRGLSTGTELEYSDAETIENALASRH